MHIVVTLKQVYDPNTAPSLLGVGADGKTLEIRSSMSPVLNGYDANAVEEAIRLKEALGGKVTAISVGDESSVAQLRRALAMGADAAVMIPGPTGLACDSDVIAELIAAAVGRLDDVDLILCGKAASDTDAGQTHLFLAEKLGFASVSPVRAIHEASAETLVVERIGDGVVQRMRARLPLLLGISNEINKPRAPALKGVMMAKKAQVPNWSAADLGLAGLQPKSVVRRLYIEPPVNVQTVMIAEGSDRANGRALAECLVAEGVL
ncbi:electron transfer flavoprotein subunit beta/FixA family protein [Pseudomonas sp. ZM23]|uniref:Electron transfer flavoprotein subunit beta/FixA family protein n=1 Tax=Pseudomonas triclosanedens TaxID=2961893 RepID=A0ABY7A402_9PSED|nr:electron transfer flavoprotein subunit beta/FixA family protein [Pseudomonas triclosanedens]MCP8465067.1 electron transfer flavoprotein subunit beta/FixA family protein [Pseudomonas triclosanedens]MCP8470221.1 electron transfer flavoprotein subunit beta/FixA family protein [Pseudomonas triclosanedens]MCP8476026.1 electron transfer flavoprotein subunit beta/FixA family protein [Pseudomonas triclosanedens]WAI51736.1 electron transfer flavoprotein subunit beta/FixA family protein [Pseudomonas t